MNRQDGVNRAQGGRVQWGSYGFLAGILVGVLMGWFFAGFVGAFFRVGMVALVVVPLILIYMGWRKIVAPLFRPTSEREYQHMGPGNAIETRAVVHRTVTESRNR